MPKKKTTKLASDFTNDKPPRTISSPVDERDVKIKKLEEKVAKAEAKDKADATRTALNETIKDIGVREHTVMVDTPVVVATMSGPTGNTNIMEIRNVEKKMQLPQPFLDDEAEVLKLGVQKWHLYSGSTAKFNQLKMRPEKVPANTYMTTVIDGRRFLITKDMYERIEHD